MAKLRNITVTLDEEVARWARIEVARNDTSVSKFLGDILKERMVDRERYAAAMKRALNRKPYLTSVGHYLSREEAHERQHLR